MEFSSYKVTTSKTSIVFQKSVLILSSLVARIISKTDVLMILAQLTRQL